MLKSSYYASTKGNNAQCSAGACARLLTENRLFTAIGVQDDQFSMIPDTKAFIRSL